MSRGLKAALADAAARALSLLLPSRITRSKRHFQLWEDRDYHVTPVHYYEPIPDTRELSDRLWEARSNLPGLRLCDDDMLGLLSRFVSRYKAEYSTFPIQATGSPCQFFLQEVSLTSVDAEIPYCFMRERKPRRIVEIGSGCTTFLEAQAIEANRRQDPGYVCSLIVIDPYPYAALKNGVQGLSEMLELPVQQVDMGVFDAVEEDGILFIDSSHVVRLGGDVVHEYLEILPQLRQGVLVHIHDIFLPYEYPKKWVFEYRLFRSEQYLLRAFMAFNDGLSTIWAASYMNVLYPDKLGDAIPSYEPGKTIPRSYWLKRAR